ncbi:MAG TPA: UTP--glucose-1-phosphate uridylyltransferase GalU [Candidatus Acidoferrales bacterium]|jgi:UTP--glucose-1-phosphate uridylyltransferase
MSSERKRVRKAVLPVAGLGTRFLPATKAQPKEMLPVVDKPLIQYAVEECIASGIESVIFVTGRRKNAIEDHFDSAPELEAFLEERGKPHQAEMVREISGGLHFSYTRQSEAKGLGHAVFCARELVGDEPFAVLLGDVIMDGAVPATRSLMEVWDATGQGAIAVEEVERARLHLYGIIAASPGNQARWGDQLLRVTDLVEKPHADKAPSNLGVTGRYVLPPEVFDHLEKLEAGTGGEIQLTDALKQLANGPGLWAHIYEGKTHDAGDKLGFLKATVEFALKNPKLGPDFREYLRGLKL